jgi:hypothetical protein
MFQHFDDPTYVHIHNYSLEPWMGFEASVEVSRWTDFRFHYRLPAFTVACLCGQRSDAWSGTWVVVGSDPQLVAIGYFNNLLDL